MGFSAYVNVYLSEMKHVDQVPYGAEGVWIGGAQPRKKTCWKKCSRGLNCNTSIRGAHTHSQTIKNVHSHCIFSPFCAFNLFELVMSQITACFNTL